MASARLLQLALISLAVWASQIPVRAQSPFDGWEPYEVLPPRVFGYGHYLLWDLPKASGDVDDDGILDIGVVGGEQTTSTFGSGFLSFFHGGSLQEVFLGAASGRKYYLGTSDYGLTFLKHPGGYRVSFLDYQRGLLVVDLPSNQVAFEVFSWPSTTPGLPDSHGPGQNSPAGDINGDGFDDLFFTSTSFPGTFPLYQIYGVADGQTMSPIWTFHRQRQSGEIHFPLFPLVLPDTQDLNGDGIGDVIFQADIIRDLTYDWTAHSGTDGSVLWQIHDLDNTGAMGRGSTLIPDVDGDGIRDLFISQSSVAGLSHLGSLRAISGATGNLIWENKVGLLDPYWNSTTHVLTFIPRPQPFGDLDDDGVSDIVIPVEVMNSSYKDHFLWIFSGATGDLLEIDDVPPDLAPFYPNDSTSKPISSFHLPLGDVTGDGFSDFAKLVWANDVTGQNGIGAAYHLAVFSRRSLSAPSFVRIGGRYALELFLPALAGQPYRVAASTIFDPVGGWLRFGDYNLHLGASALLTASLASPQMAGHLDAGGYSRLLVNVPSNPALIGSKVILVAGAGGVAGGRFARSTFCEVEIRP